MVEMTELGAVEEGGEEAVALEGCAGYPDGCAGTPDGYAGEGAEAAVAEEGRGFGGGDHAGG